jgi:hypothetical protein
MVRCEGRLFYQICVKGFRICVRAHIGAYGAGRCRAMQNSVVDKLRVEAACPKDVTFGIYRLEPTVVDSSHFRGDNVKVRPQIVS